MYDIQKCNANDEINFYMGYNEKNVKVMKIPYNSAPLGNF
jgi:hypothetical protein